MTKNLRINLLSALGILCIVVLLVLIYSYTGRKDDVITTSSTTPTSPENVQVSEKEITQEELENYHKVYKEPSVIYLRSALNAYLENKSEGSGIIEAAVYEDNIDNITSGLDSFSKEYYKSKFIVLTINENMTGGTDLQILFQDKPDRIFYAWVYELADGSYNLYGFNSRNDLTEETMKEMVKTFETWISDKEYSI